MNVKFQLSLFIGFISLITTPTLIKAVTVDELSAACQVIESSLQDISIEYDWRVVPPWTHEEAEAEMQMPMLEVKDGLRHFNLLVSGFEIKQGTKRSSLTGPEKWLIQQSAIITTEDGNSWSDLSQESYDGTSYKKLSIGGWPTETRNGIIEADPNKYRPELILSPVGFSVFRTALSNVTNKTPLSAMLREQNLVILHPETRQVNGFDTVCVDFLQEYTKQVVGRIYFSIDHGYTPVRYEYINGFGTPNEKMLTVDVFSLEQVDDGLWFPSSGTISSSNENRINMFQTIGKIIVNQGLENEDFDIKFPTGTRVYNKINDTEYVIKEVN
jgi:hypothetical protein